MHSAIPIMRALLDAGANINLQAVLGETVLILAASGRGGESIELLLARGADPNLADRKKKTPLMWMVDTLFHRGVDTSLSIAPLVEAGARVNDRDAAGQTVLLWAVTGLGTSFDVWPKVLAALVDHGADVSATDSNGETAMFALVRYADDALALDAVRDASRSLSMREPIGMPSTMREKLRSPWLTGTIRSLSSCCAALASPTNSGG